MREVIFYLAMIIEIFIIIIILGILVGTGLMLCCMAASTDREKDDAEQLKWIHQLSEEKRSECKSDT